MKPFKILLAVVALGSAALIAGCQPSPTPAPATPTAALPTATPEPPTPTPIPERNLTVCLTSEPSTLFPYGGSSRSQWSVLEGVYDGPFDTVNYMPQPVILQSVPSLADGSAVLQAVEVRTGDQVVDASGALVGFQKGVRVFPSGCASADCVVEWDGFSDILMDQLSVTYRLKEGLLWSDGQPLKASDSVYSFNLAGEASIPVSKALVDRTASYSAADDLTVQWMGVPGYFDARFDTFFWMPLPEHAWGQVAPADLLNDANANQKPLGWGPYAVEEWTTGDHIRLRKNPNYFRAAEGLPYFDTVTFRFTGPTADAGVAALLAGECDVLDQGADFYSQFEYVLNLQGEKKLQTFIGQGPEWEHLDFGVRPAAYDDGYVPASGDRLDLLSDARTRQAFAYCINREELNSKFFYNRSSIPSGVLPAGHPYLSADAQPIAYDPAAGQQLLDEAGWRDLDNDPATPRTALGVLNVPDGTPLSLTYLTTTATVRQEVAQQISNNLAACGIQAAPQYLNPGDLFAAGPDGAVFGRKFDLVQFSWDSGSRPNCAIYSTDQIPSGENRWVGANISGLSDPAYDAACEAARSARPDDPNLAAVYQTLQTEFDRALPAIPLYYSLKMAAARPDLCGLSLDVSARSLLWNIESIDYGETCPQS